MPYCRSCGQVIDENSKFCPHCGASVTSVTTKTYSHTIPIMLFVLGLFLIGIGVVVEMPAETLPPNYAGIPFGEPPTIQTIHPYEAQATLLIFIGIIAIVAGFILARTKRRLF